MAAMTAVAMMPREADAQLKVGGYGEVALTRNFYSDNVYRYSDPKKYANDPSHGRFDIPHAVIYLSYDFGKGWLMSSEIEFEHTGTGCAQEKEFSEGGEWEQEIEKGGEVELEQFWIQKTFCKEFNVRVGHIIVPVGLLNTHHEPLNFFTVYRPEGEGTILPSTWHDTGFSLWGRSGDFRYELQMIAGLDAFQFNRENWVQNGAGSSAEFKVANKYGFAARVDNYTIPGVRIGVSGYYGKAMHNSFPHDLEGDKYNSAGEYEGEKQLSCRLDARISPMRWQTRRLAIPIQARMSTILSRPTVTSRLSISATIFSVSKIPFTAAERLTEEIPRRVSSNI